MIDARQDEQWICDHVASSNVERLAAITEGSSEIIRASTIFAERMSMGGDLLWLGDDNAWTHLLLYPVAVSRIHAINKEQVGNLDSVIVCSSSPGIVNLVELSERKIPTIGFGCNLCKYDPGVKWPHYLEDRKSVV